MVPPKEAQPKMAEPSAGNTSFRSRLGENRPVPDQPVPPRSDGRRILMIPREPSLIDEPGPSFKQPDMGKPDAD